MACLRWSSQMALPNVVRNLVTTNLVSPYGCTSSLSFLYKQRIIPWYSKKDKPSQWHTYQPKPTILALIIQESPLVVFIIKFSECIICLALRLYKQPQMFLLKQSF
jgi:hypothetical protein